MTETITNTTPWAAGLFEGEGSITIDGARVKATIQMTDLDILERMQEAFGGQVYFTGKQQEHHKDSWRWYISKTSDAIAFLNEIYPYMGTRRRARIEEARIAATQNRSILAKEKHDKVRQLRSEGLKHREIAERLGVDRTYVSHILRGAYASC